MNFARSVIYTTAPSFPMVAAIRAGYNLLKTGATKKVRIDTATRIFLLLRCPRRKDHELTFA